MSFYCDIPKAQHRPRHGEGFQCRTGKGGEWREGERGKEGKRERSKEGSRKGERKEGKKEERVGERGNFSRIFPLLLLGICFS